MIVSVDFDGTITEASSPDKPGFNVLRPACAQVMWKLHHMGVKFYLLTGRREEWIPEAVQLCKKWGLPIDTSHPNTKVISDFYIDDKNIGCVGIDWLRIYDMLHCAAMLEREEAVD